MFDNIELDTYMSRYMKPYSYTFLFKSVFNRLKSRFHKNDQVSTESQLKDGAPKRKNFDLIGKYYNLKYINHTESTVDDRTWNDLDMDDVFLKIDQCVSPTGRQFLYAMLHTQEPEKAAERYTLYRRFTDNPDICRGIEKTLSMLGKSSYYTVNLIYQELPDKPRLFPLFIVSPVMLVLSLVLTLFNNYFFLAVLGIAVMNLIIHHKYTTRIIGYLPDVYSLRKLLTVSSILCNHSGNDIPQIETLKKHKDTIHELSRNVGWLIFDNARLDELLSSAIEYLNVFFLANLISFFHTINILEHYKDELRDIFEATASLDAAVSIATYLASLPSYCSPLYNDDNTIEFGNIYHPLLDNAVPNSFTLSDRSCLITGSNMAGKTTFMKTVGINIILANSLGFCHAESANIPDVLVRSTMKRTDSIIEHKSYYFQEIEAVQNFLDLSQPGTSYLFLIDEIFRGTNTLERISAATAVLEHLSRNSLVMVTTHDIELHALLNGTYKMLHFSEQIEGDRHFFDYTVKTGPTLSRNAIRLLELKGYPKAVTDRAHTLAHQLSNKYP